MRPIKTKISIKTETDIQRRIKIEPDSPSHSARNKFKQEKQTSPKKVSLKTTEKQLLVEKIAALQKENQRIVHSSLEYKKQQSKIEQENSKKIRSLTMEISQLRTQLKMVESNLANTKCNNEKTISDLRNENRSLQARVKQLQSSVNIEIKQEKMLNSSAYHSDSDSENRFEVEKLVGHKKKRDGMHYLVRWKNYTKQHDTWEREKNLSGCSKILNEYKQQNNLVF